MGPIRIDSGDATARLHELHNDAHVGFDASDDGTRDYWPSVTCFLLARRHDDPALAKRLRDAEAKAGTRELGGEPAERRLREIEAEAAATRQDGWEAREPELARKAVAAKFEQDLRARAALLSTGDADLACDDAPYLPELLHDARAAARLRLSDAGAIQCRHRDAASDRTVQVCVHLMTAEDREESHRWFTGRGSESLRVCHACAELREASQVELRIACGWCAGSAFWPGMAPVTTIGEPEVQDRRGVCALDLVVHTRLPEDVIRVVPDATADSWLVLADDGSLDSLHASGARTRIATLPSDLFAAITTEHRHAYKRSLLVELHVSPRGDFIAIVANHNTRGVVVERATGRVALQLTRGDYHLQDCPWPIAFLDHGGHPVLVHATEWNRLDATDLTTGALLTTRETDSTPPRTPRTPHYLNYFHGPLTVSPDGRRLASGGWFWGACGLLRVFEVGRWLDANPHESEDGASVVEVLTHGVWEEPFDWVDAETIAYPSTRYQDFEEPVPGVELRHVGSGDPGFAGGAHAEGAGQEGGARIRTIVGPRDRFVIDDGMIYAWTQPGTGASLWDLATGQRLARHEDAFVIGYHRASQCLWGIVDDDRLFTLHARHLTHS